MIYNGLDHVVDLTYKSIVSFQSAPTDDIDRVVGLMYESIVSFSTVFTDD